MTQRLLRLDDVADRLGVSHPTVWRRVQDGTIPSPVKVGRMSRWIEAEIDAAIAALAEAREVA